MVLSPEQKQRRLAKIQEMRKRPLYKILTPCQKLQRFKNIQRMRNNPVFKENSSLNSFIIIKLQSSIGAG